MAANTTVRSDYWLDMPPEMNPSNLREALTRVDACEQIVYINKLKLVNELLMNSSASMKLGLLYCFTDTV